MARAGPSPASMASALALAAALMSCARTAGPPFPAEKALGTLKVEEGFTIDLFAAEPQIASPVAMDFDESGRIFVVEMPGYPLDTRPTGRIRLLEDRDGDGRPERSTVFADGLVLPTGVMRWKKGVLVTAAPDVWYLEDADGDGRAERREKVLTGFAFSNPQHTVNSPVYGLDNWIYLAHEGPAEAVIYKDEFGDPGRDIRFADGRSAPVKVGRHAVRFRPDTGQIEALSGSSQFGHGFDEWGHHFTLDNSNHLRHEVVAAAYLKRNPDLPLRSAMQNVSDHGSNAKVFAITRRPRFELLTEPGEFTSACSLTFYLGGAFPPGIGRSSFVAEPAQNLVHRDVWSEKGSTFTGRRAREGVEFLASTDSWFRPVNMTVGPDGALYVVDYYRQMIEHPEWASTHVHHHSADMYAGQDRGRIYRIQPASHPLPPPRGLRLGEASEEELVSQLANPNLWWRRTAQRLLVERRSPRAAAALGHLFRDSPSPVGRLHALWTLEGLGQLEDTLVEQALGDAEAGVRENAIRLAEPRLGRSPSLMTRLLALAADPSPKVRFQLLCTLGSVDSPASRAVQDKLLIEDIEDEWVPRAALSASPKRAAEYLEAALSPRWRLTATETNGRAAFLRLASSVIGARPVPEEVRRVLLAVKSAPEGTGDWWRTALLEGLAQGARGRGTLATSADTQPTLLALFESPAAPVRRAALTLLEVAGLPPGPRRDAVLRHAAELAADAKAPAERRADAVRLLTLAGAAPRKELFVRLVDPREPEEVQAAAVRALGRVGGEETGRFLLAHWRNMTAPVRSEAADALLREPGPTRLLIAALQKGEVQTWSLDFGQKRDLIMHDDPAIRALARPLLEEPPGGRESVLKRYEAALDLAGDARRGEQTFERVCAKCHRLNGRGAEVGPDLGSVRNRAPALLLQDILVPSRAIAQNYESYVVETSAGDTLDGVLGAQSPTAIVLRREGGKETIVPRGTIRKMYAANLSAMPADLEQQVDVQQMADVIKYITTSH
jgi:putative membrane-bound dehydrogenase-like protein